MGIKTIYKLIKHDKQERIDVNRNLKESVFSDKMKLYSSFQVSC